MDSISLIGMASIIAAGLTIGIGAIGPALGEGRALSSRTNQPGLRQRCLWGWP